MKEKSPENGGMIESIEPKPKKCCNYQRLTCGLEELCYRAGVISAASNYRLRPYDLLAGAGYLDYCRRHQEWASYAGIVRRMMARVGELRLCNEAPLDLAPDLRHPRGRR